MVWVAEALGNHLAPGGYERNVESTIGEGADTAKNRTGLHRTVIALDQWGHSVLSALPVGAAERRGMTTPRKQLAMT